MARKRSAPAKGAAKPKAEPKKGAGRGRKIEPATKATFGVDDKRAQYARLVVFNFGVQEGVIPKSKDVNSATNAELQKAGLLLAAAGSTMLHGTGGIELIQKLSKNGASDEKVAKRGLTTAYAQEVRPFIRRLTLADSFGRRGKKEKAEKKEEAPAAEEKAAA